MSRIPRHDILFEPIQLGPKTMRNRFLQVPHCNGAGSDRPGMQAEFRGMKAEGGWGAVFTEVCFFTHDSDSMPWVGSKIIDQGDIKNLSLMCDRIHEHGSLAGVELTHGASFNFNAETRMPGRGVSQIPNDIEGMANVRALTKSEILKMQRDHVDGCLRARDAGFDLLTIFGGLASMTSHFLFPFFNRRTDEYGGSFENRCRFSIELFELLRKEITGVAIGMRYQIDTLDEPYGYGDLGVRAQDEGAKFIEVMDDYMDYWDINIGTLNWGEDAGSSRFFETNHEAEYTKHARAVSKKPLINVGRFTDPDVMVKAINSGQCDIIGAARPSIADPFLPNKIENGDYDDIRECIGCNVCVSRWETGGPPIWCTQNPTSGEEYRRGWHPENYIKTDNPDRPILVVGAGPAGMECAMVLGLRGYSTVHLVDANPTVGGHLNWVSKIPGFALWKRVIDWRETQIRTKTYVGFNPDSYLGYEDVLEMGAEHVIFATGSRWDGSGMSPATRDIIVGADASQPHVCTPEQVLLEGKPVGKRVLVIDNDAYFMGSALAQMFGEQGHDVHYVTHNEKLGPYLRYTLEEQRTYEALVKCGVKITSDHLVVSVENGVAELVSMWFWENKQIEYDSVVLVTQRLSQCEIYDRLLETPEDRESAGIKSIHLIGDANSPGMIAQAVFSGSRLAREFDDENPDEFRPFIRERRLLDSTEADYQLDSTAIRS